MLSTHFVWQQHNFCRWKDMIEDIINECMSIDLEAELSKKPCTTAAEPKKKKTKSAPKQAREQKVNQP